MKLLSTKKVLKNNSFLTHLLCVGASYLACVSSEGMEDQKGDNLGSNKRAGNNYSTSDSDSSEEDSKSRHKRRIADEDLSPAEIEKIEKRGKIRPPLRKYTACTSTTDLMGGSK